MPDGPEAIRLDMPMSHACFGFPSPRANETAGELCRAAEDARLLEIGRCWLDANIDAACTSYSNVVEADPGHSVTLSDICSEDVHMVMEAFTSPMLVKHDIIFGRVMTVGDEYCQVAEKVKGRSRRLRCNDTKTEE